MTDQSPAPIGHNNPPTDAEILRDTLADKNRELLDRAQALIEAADRAPATIEDDETEEKITAFLGSIAKCEKSFEGKRVSEKEPYLTLGRVVDGFFKNQMDALEKARRKVKPALDARLLWKRDQERKRQQEEAAERKRLADEQAAQAAAAEAAKQPIKADELMTTAMNTEASANRMAEKAEGKISVVSRSSDGASANLRSVWKIESTDRNKLNLELLRHHFTDDAIQMALNSYLRTMAKPVEGQPLEGARIWEHTESVVR
jgi:hypothetical protein